VAGVISTRFSTPLSHVNLRARAWGIPNATLKDAATRYAAMDGQFVRLEVRNQGHVLRPATEKELTAWKQAREAARTVLVPDADLTIRELRPLKAMRAVDSRLFGTKAANLGEIVQARLKGVNVPDGFGIPFELPRRGGAQALRHRAALGVLRSVRAGGRQRHLGGRAGDEEPL
jgi:hypothetical protein